MRQRSSLLVAAIVLEASCSRAAPPAPPAAGEVHAVPVAPVSTEEPWRSHAARLAADVERHGIREPAVVAAVRSTPRHRFIPGALPLELAYADRPLPIGHEQTISQPYVVAFMVEAAKLSRTANVLEVGTGSGYGAAILAEVLGLGRGSDAAAAHGRLCSIEIIPALAERASGTLQELGYRDVAVRAGDGYRGWSERAPFDAIVVTAAPDHVPEPLKQQLAIGGRLVLPVGRDDQHIVVLMRTAKGFTETRLLPVRFVPMTGEAEEKR